MLLSSLQAPLNGGPHPKAPDNACGLITRALSARVLGAKRPVPPWTLFAIVPDCGLGPRKARANRNRRLDAHDVNREANGGAEELALTRAALPAATTYCSAAAQIGNPRRRPNNGHCRVKKNSMKTRRANNAQKKRAQPFYQSNPV
jgi:hypothetical protein